MPVWREAHFQVKMYKHHMLGPLLEIEMSKKCTPLWRKAHLQVEKVHAVVARSTFRSQHVQNTPLLGPLLEVEMSKKCTPLLREAHFEVKMLKAPHVRATFGSCRKSARRSTAKHMSKSKC